MAANGHATKERVLPPAPLLPSIFTCGKTNSSSDVILAVLLLLLDNSRFGVSHQGSGSGPRGQCDKITHTAKITINAIIVEVLDLDSDLYMVTCDQM